MHFLPLLFPSLCEYKALGTRHGEKRQHAKMLTSFEELGVQVRQAAGDGVSQPAAADPVVGLDTQVATQRALRTTGRGTGTGTVTACFKQGAQYESNKKKYGIKFRCLMISISSSSVKTGY